MSETLVNWLEDTVTRFGDAEAVVHGERRITYQQLWQQVKSITAYLRDNGLVKGDRVALLLENSIDYIAAYYGVLAAGGAVVALNTDVKARDINNWLGHSGATFLFANARHSEIGQVAETNRDKVQLVLVGENNRIQIFSQQGELIDEWRQFGRPSGIYITPDDTIYVADSESGPDTGAGELMGIMKGIRVGSAIDGSVHAFIEDMEPLTDPHSGAEGVGVDASGNVYGAVVRRRMLERHVLD